MIRFNLDKNVQLNFYEQIKGQLVSAIYCGKIKEGDRLPSIRELAEDLNVNYKTIRKIFLHLADEGYLDLVRGSGAYLKRRTGPQTWESMRRKAIIRLIGEVTEKAGNLGLSPQKFARIYQNYCQGTNLKNLKLIVVDHGEEAFVFSRELRNRLGVEVKALSLEQIDELNAAEEVDGADFILTTSWHMDQIREFVEGLDIGIVEIKPSHTIYIEILKAAQDKNVAIVIQDERTMHASLDIFMNIYHPSTTKKFWITSIEREDLVEEILREADLIFVSPICWDEMRKRAPSDKELKTYENFISDETIGFLREIQLLG